ncbi:hypothetical protein O9992_06000 [Vibrio lentus]|nr:hypothetical protein [Vibrio lentus]
MVKAPQHVKMVSHSHIQANTIPNCILTTQRLLTSEWLSCKTVSVACNGENQENVYYYLTTVMNENYAMPAMPEGAEEGICKVSVESHAGAKGKVQPMELPGTIMNEARKAAEILSEAGGRSI